MTGPTRWGIVSAGSISSVFVTALKGLPADEHQVIAIAARELNDAKEFAKKHDILKAYGSYEELTKDQELDIVYIGTIHPHHHAVTMMALNHGKHVLCEKPLAMNYAEAKEMIDFAREKKLFLMEGLWSRFFPVYHKLREQLKENAVGKVNYVTVNFGKNIQHIPRLKEKSLGGGCVLDLGVYAIQMALLVYDHEEPEKIIASGILNDQGVDYCDSITMYFKDKRVAQLNLHQESVLSNCAVISGDKGNIEVPKFSRPDTIKTVDGKTYHFPLPYAADCGFPDCGGFQYEAKAVRECLLQGKLEHELHPHSATLLIAKCMDEVLKEVDVTYK